MWCQCVYHGETEELAACVACLIQCHCPTVCFSSNTLGFLLPAEISTVLCDNQNKAETLLQTREGGQTPVLKTIVIMDSFNSELVNRGAQCGVDIVSMQDVEVLHAVCC